MYSRIAEQPDLSSRWTTRSSSETLQHIEKQIEALISHHSSLMNHKRAIEQQLASIAAQIHEPEVMCSPRAVFLLLEIRGSGGVSEQVEQIAHIVHEQGYWKPRGRVQNYCMQDVYHLGKSVQKLFNDYEVVDRRVEQLQAWLRHVKQSRQMEAEKTLQGVFECLAATIDTAAVQEEVNVIVELLGQAVRPRWFRWLFVHRSNKK